MIYKNGETIKNRYRIISHIGKGATANVYLVNDLMQKKEVALKVSKANAKVTNNDKRFIQEAKLLISMDDENIIKGYEVFEFDNKIMISMEYIDGESLDEKLNREDNFTPEESVFYIIQVAKALIALHKKGVMHRDLKPSNLLIEKNKKNVKLMDFGIAQVSEDQGFTKQGNIIGTIGYMSPEVIKGQKANPLSEIYSLGVMTYKMLVGSLPFGKGRDIEVARRIIAGGSTPAHVVNKKIPVELSRVVMKMMSLEPENRYQDLTIVIGIFESFLSGQLKEKQGFRFFRRK